MQPLAKTEPIQHVDVRESHATPSPHAISVENMCEHVCTNYVTNETKYDIYTITIYKVPLRNTT